MKFYHGTDKSTGDDIQLSGTKIDPTKGGGELGQGFYVGDSLTLAISWAKGRYKAPAVLEFDVDNGKYAALSFKQMSHGAVLHSWRQLKKLGTSRTHTFGTDVVFGPLATAVYAAQYKFESATASTELDDATIDRIL